MGLLVRCSLRFILFAVFLQQNAALPACLDWIVVKIDETAHTWLEYEYWYGAKYGWNPAAAWQAYLEEGEAWHQFLLDMATVHRLTEMGLERPTAREIEQAVLSVWPRFPRDMDPDLLRQAVENLVRIRNYRDQVFRYTLTIPPDEIRRRYEELRKQQPEISLDEVYEALQAEIWQERRDELFHTWQTDQIRQYTVTRLPPPAECMPNAGPRDDPTQRIP